MYFMNQKIPAYVITLIAGIIFLGIIGYFIFVKKSESAPKEQTSTSTQTTNSINTSTQINNVLPSGSVFIQHAGDSIDLSWNIENAPADSATYLDLLSSDNNESLGRITNNPDCSDGGDTIALANSIKSYKWNGVYICSNWQAHLVNPGSYKIGVSLYSKDGTNILANGQSKLPFKIQNNK